MYNSILFNGGLYNGTFNLGGIQTSNENLSFNGFGLQNEKIITSNVDFEKIDRDFVTASIPNGHGKIINSDFWRLKRITISGMMNGATRTELDNTIDEFKKELAVQNKNFDFITGDGTKRRYFCTASVIDVDRSEHFMITLANFRVIFDCLVPFGQDLEYTVNDYTVNELEFSEVLENKGNAPGDPVFLLIVNTATAITGINLKNNTTSQEIEITETISASDVLIFDSELKKVTLNGTEIDFDGQFPIVNAGSNSYTVTATGTDIEYELTAKVIPKYL